MSGTNDFEVVTNMRISGNNQPDSREDRKIISHTGQCILCSRCQDISAMILKT
jgi:hypothetical protein